MSNVINGTTGSDTLTGTTGDDTINALGGNDIIIASSGHDTVDGGAGTDRIRVDATSPGLFLGSVAENYMMTATRLTNGSGTLDTTFTSIERLELTDLRSGNSRVDLSGFSGSTTVVLGNGNHLITGAKGSTNSANYITVGLGSNTIDAGGGLSHATINVDGSVDAPVVMTGVDGSVSGGTQSGGLTYGGTYVSGSLTVSYTTAGAAQQTTLTNGYAIIQSGTSHGLFVDASNAPLSYSTGFVVMNGMSVPVYSAFGVWLVDSNYNDVEIGSRYNDEIASASNGSSTVNGGIDTLVGNGGADYYDYELAIQNVRGDHLLDFDSDDKLAMSYYLAPGQGEPTFIGTAQFTGVARQIRYEAHDGKTYVQVDVDGDRVADGTVVIESGEYQLVGTDAGGTGSNATLMLAASQNMVSGTDSAETLNGTSGADVLRGYGGNDIIYGGAGNDLIDGGKGADQMYGGTGDDTYLVDNAGDVVRENAGEGIDNVLASVSYVLSDNVERLTLTGTADINGTGNALDNMIWGNEGNNVLDGGLGNDTIRAGGGNDTIIGGSGSDTIDGGDGHDVATFAALSHSFAITAANGTSSLARGNTNTTIVNVEDTSFLDGHLITDADSAGAQIQRIYDTVLGRPADLVGLNFWLKQIETGGAGLTTVANAFVSSAEFQTNTGGLTNSQFVDYIYQHALGRGADQGGHDYWTAQLDAGVSRGDMVTSFSETAEHRARTANIVSAGYFETDPAYQQVALLYDGGFGRLPDADGVTFWAGSVKSGAYSLAQVADAFAGSAEFQHATAGLSNGQLVEYMYQHTLHRGADSGGLSYWSDQLDHGLSKGALLLNFGESAEHANLDAANILNGIVIA